ncbi:MAG: nucleotidyltransferase [Chloroflexi bacterium]|nr:nucleotidyltransferase [Chloroflexota bacterium]
MATTLPAQWEQTHARIGIERENAIKAHLEVRVVLETDRKLREWGVDTVLIGSYKRKTAIYPCKDVDVFVKLPAAPDNATPEQVFTEVQRVLVAHFGDRATEQRRSLKVSGFADDLTCDAVPAVPDGERWKIPQTDTKPVGERWIKDRWESTNPERLTDLTIEAQQASSSISGQPCYLRTVRLIKQMRDTHVGPGEKPGGLYFELLTYWAFRDGAVADSYAELLVPVLDSITMRLSSGVTVTEPAMDQPYAPAPDPAALTKAAIVFGRLAADARRALTLEECAAALVWREMLGKNDKVGWAFPLPPGCTETGARIAPVVNRDRGSNADRGFA